MASFEAFINEDTTQAKQLYREFFIESAQEINKQLEEGMDEEVDADEDAEVVEEGFGMFEADDEPEAELGGDMGDDLLSDVEADGEDFGAEDDAEGGLPTADQWAEIKDAFDELEALFDEDGSGESDEDLGLDDGAGDELDMDTLEFGDESEEDELKEGVELRKVADPGMDHETEAHNTKSPIAKQGKSPTGATATSAVAGDGTVTGSNTKLDDSAESPDVDDQCNVMDSGKKAYSATKEPNMKSEEGGVHKQSLVKDMRK